MAEQRTLNRQIWALAWPALGTLLADPLLSLVDTLFVGRLGTVELAALGICTALFGFAFALFNFLAYATTPLVAQTRGRGDLVGSGRVVVCGLVLALSIGLVAGTILLTAAQPLIRLMQAAPEVIGPAQTYLQVRAGAIPALLIITLGHGAYRGFQDTRTPLRVALLANTLNALLDPLFIFGMNWGLAGAAWATVIAQWIGAGWFLWLLHRRSLVEGWERRVPSWQMFRSLISIGGAVVLRTMMLVTSLTLATAVAARISTVAVAAHQILSQIWFLLAMAVDSLAIAAQALVGWQIGQGQTTSTRSVSHRLLWWGAVLGLLLAVGLAVVAPGLSAVFGVEESVGQAINRSLPLLVLLQPLASILFVFDGIYLGALAIRRLVYSTTAGLGATLIFLALTLWGDWGLRGVWLAISAMVLGRTLVLGFDYWGRSGLQKFNSDSC